MISLKSRERVARYVHYLFIVFVVIIPGIAVRMDGFDGGIRSVGLLFCAYTGISFVLGREYYHYPSGYGYKKGEELKSRLLWSGGIGLALLFLPAIL